MIDRIKILPPSEAQKIAAGEVVERPANILKELLENSIDAASSNIVIEIKDAGKSLIKVDDDGCGIDADDLALAVHPHATSKISTVDDLTEIRTFGFRGEALASIAAVAKFTITSRQAIDSFATNAVFEHGEVASLSSVARSPGSSVEVKDLFYNIPVRKKFLKQDETEWNQIVQLVYAVALSHLNISFKLIHNQKVFLHAPAVKNLNDRVAQLWGVNIASQFMSLETKKADISLSGVISSHQYWRYGKHQIFLFVNGRWIKNPELIKAFIKGYGNILPTGKFPAGVLSLTIDRASIDVNVHPKKEEVRFSRPGVVCNAITDAISELLRNKAVEAFIPTSSLSEISSIDTSVIEPETTRTIFVGEYLAQADRELKQKKNFFSNNNDQRNFHALGNIFAVSRVEPSSDSSNLIGQGEPGDIQKQVSMLNDDKNKTVFSGKIIGQILNTYIILETPDGLTFVDQHAAHERILYEQMKDSIIARQSILLMFPFTINLPLGDIEIFEQYEDIFLQLGLSCNRMGPQSLAIKSVPLGVANIDIEQILRLGIDLVQNMQKDESKQKVQQALYQHVHSHLACKKAVKSGDKLLLEQMEKLIEDIAKTEFPFICIHGRPTYWQLSQTEIAKFFQRL